jgi:hypothetical protein
MGCCCPNSNQDRITGGPISVLVDCPRRVQKAQVQREYHKDFGTAHSPESERNPKVCTPSPTLKKCKRGRPSQSQVQKSASTHRSHPQARPLPRAPTRQPPGVVLHRLRSRTRYTCPRLQFMVVSHLAPVSSRDLVLAQDRFQCHRRTKLKTTDQEASKS